MNAPWPSEIWPLAPVSRLRPDQGDDVGGDLAHLVVVVRAEAQSSRGRGTPPPRRARRGGGAASAGRGRRGDRAMVARSPQTFLAGGRAKMPSGTGHQGDHDQEAPALRAVRGRTPGSRRRRRWDRPGDQPADQGADGALEAADHGRGEAVDEDQVHVSRGRRRTRRRDQQPGQGTGDAGQRPAEGEDAPTRTPSSRAISRDEGGGPHPQPERRCSGTGPACAAISASTDDQDEDVEVRERDRACCPTRSPLCEKAAGKPRLALPKMAPARPSKRIKRPRVTMTGLSSGLPVQRADEDTLGHRPDGEADDEHEDEGPPVPDAAVEQASRP